MASQAPSVLSTMPHPQDRAASGMRDFAELQHRVEHLAEYLPSQGPIRVFVHHNTLHCFEHLPFSEGLKAGAKLYGCRTYLPEQRYRDELRRERIRLEDLAAAVQADPACRDENPLPLGSRMRLRLAMLEHPLSIGQDSELQWLVAEGALRRIDASVSPAVRRQLVEGTRKWVLQSLLNEIGDKPPSSLPRGVAAVAQLIDVHGRRRIEQWREETWEAFTLQALWRLCHQGVHSGTHHEASPERPRLRDLLLEATGQDADEQVDELLIRFCSAFLDQGVADWPLPNRDEGFFAAFVRMFETPSLFSAPWTRELSRELSEIRQNGLSPLQVIEESISLLGVKTEELDALLMQTMLAVRGWAGMIWQMETNAEWTPRPAPRGTLVEFVAVRLLLDRLAASWLAQQTLGYAGPLSGLKEAVRRRGKSSRAHGSDRLAFTLFQLSQFLGWLPEQLIRLTHQDWNSLAQEVHSFSSTERCRLFQEAYERRYRLQSLDALSLHTGGAPTADMPRFQLITCIDDREESFRRHLEEIDPSCETFSVAGFFAAAMYYRGAADAHFVPLCPIVIKPQHYVEEEVAYSLHGEHLRRSEARRRLGSATHRFHTQSRSFAGGALTALVGSLASIPMVMRILFPRATAKVRRLFGEFVQPPSVTQLRLERLEEKPGRSNGQIGFSLTEMAAIVRRMLEDIGLLRGFSPLIIVTGHGSSSLNNPHESAYNCGACGGGRGGPNARAVAQMANDPRVRAELARQGLDLPSTTHFVGAYHDTCSDNITYFDLDRLPIRHRKLFDEVKATIDQARERNAHERCRRFESAPLEITPDAALKHVEERSEDLSQARPEYNHATNALCIVGRRHRTRGMFMDRRAFLTSYDPTQDDEQATILARILGAVIPVCAGISLEYYFSTVDVKLLGCGSKLPHNIVSLIGVMEGAASDLRTGLSAQMTEIHEPVRLLFVIETTPRKMLAIMDANPTISLLCRNGWVQIATLSPDSNRIDVFKNGEFHPYTPEASSLPTFEVSADWYRGQRGFLRFARQSTAKNVSSDGEARRS